VEILVNQRIKDSLPVVCEEMDTEKARKSGALGVFGNKYGERVKVYDMGGFSREICAGPHAKNTAELGKFKIIKGEASSQGVRRIRAVLE
jgi:alanyl-tRNA synthetase